MDHSVVMWLFVGSGLLFSALGVPLAMGKVPPNPIYGFRTARTLSDPPTWYRINRACGIDFVVLGIVVAAAALVTGRAFRSDPSSVAALANCAIMLAGVFAATAHGFALLKGRRL